jgi:hypothetical protein
MTMSAVTISVMTMSVLPARQACVLEGRVFALGGYDGSSWLTTCESLDPRTVRAPRTPQPAAAPRDGAQDGARGLIRVYRAGRRAHRLSVPTLFFTVRDVVRVLGRRAPTQNIADWEALNDGFITDMAISPREILPDRTSGPNRGHHGYDRSHH